MLPSPEKPGERESHRAGSLAVTLSTFDKQIPESGSVTWRVFFSVSADQNDRGLNPSTFACTGDLPMACKPYSPLDGHGPSTL